jgi:hypothetical protein
MKESFYMKFKIPTQSKEGHDEKLILVAAMSKDADDVKMLARGIVGTGMEFPNLSVDQDINSTSSKLKGDLTIPRKISHEVNTICSGASTATEIMANSLAVSSNSLLSLFSTKFSSDSLLPRSS